MSVSNVATTAVVPRCPRCGLPVRSSVQLRTDAVDLCVRAVSALTHYLRQGTKPARAAHFAMASVERDVEALDAELAGHHYLCPVH
jgi:hypothetical protein